MGRSQVDGQGMVKEQAWTGPAPTETLRKTPVHLRVESTWALTATAICEGVEDGTGSAAIRRDGVAWVLYGSVVA